jgi:hypothetical protein
MTALKLHITDLKARRKARWGIISSAAYIPIMTFIVIYQIATGRSWYWWAMGLVILALFVYGFVNSIKDFREARTHYSSVDELLKDHS